MPLAALVHARLSARSPDITGTFGSRAYPAAPSCLAVLCDSPASRCNHLENFVDDGEWQLSAVMTFRHPIIECMRNHVKHDRSATASGAD